VSAKIRADELLVARGLAPARSAAQSLIMAGRVLKGPDTPVKKAGEMLPQDAALTITPGRLYVSRGGVKLEGALKAMDISPAGMNCLDLGSSTGGFTDCLLKHGAKSVTAVDTGRGLMHQSLRGDPRLTLIEGFNARYLGGLDLEGGLKGPFDLAVMDLSFISLELILPQAAPFMAERGLLLPMVKPQFEVGRRDVGKGGVVRDPRLIAGAAEKIKAAALSLTPPWRTLMTAPSVLKGPKGNQEIFVLLARAR
jgi:23S rRNA (cytidine1920-2'-O)/16S rRNA (cytidine1409-2'-O)-methyltransferase